MKKIGFWNNYTCFANNKAFDPNAYGIGEDLAYPLLLLKEKLEKEGYILETLDLDKPENYEIILFCDYPNPETCCVDITSIPKEKKYLLLTECELVYKPNARKDLLENFGKVFTYDDALIKECGYKKLFLPNKIKAPLFVPYNNKKISTVIAGNRTIKEKGELYSERLKAIRFMEKNHPNEFDLFGFNWDKKTFTGPKVITYFNRFNNLRKTFAEKHICYRGKIDNKLEVLSKYKFCFCYENTNAIPGYISEKIWDCFFAGCIPIYYGAPNVTDYIPDNVFIDFRNFNSYEELYNFLININEEQYNQYLRNTKEFLLSDKAYNFSAENYAYTLIKEIKNI